ncbi:MAG TPA: glycosyltransferase family 39 protein [Actinocrinis sp.]|nr:glycosyltransferase family 39 protein [Actinocrinis sp.]
MSSTMNEGGRPPGTDEQDSAAQDLGAAERTAQERRDLLFELFQSHKRLDRLSDRADETGEPGFEGADGEPEFTVVYPTGGARIPQQATPDAATPPDLLIAPDAMAILAEPVAPAPPTAASPTAPASPTEHSTPSASPAAPPAINEPEPPRAQPTETRQPAAVSQPIEMPPPVETSQRVDLQQRVESPLPQAPDLPGVPQAPVNLPTPKRFGDKVSWRDTAPYEETGILIRPADWSTDRIETALINVGTLRAAERKADASLAGKRRAGLSRLIPTPRRGILLAILCLQAFLSLRNSNTAFEDEALYLYSGHLELAHLLNGQPIDNFAAYFSGAPVLYPIVGAIADQIGGVFAARLLSLAFMLGATCLVYLIGRRIFGVRSALCGAGLFGTTASAIFMGGFATYDAPCVFLLALAAWIVVRGSHSSWPYYALAVLPMLLAVGTKYASLLFIPTVIALSCITAIPYHGWRWALLRPISLTAMIGSMAYGALKLAGPTYVHGIQQTTTARAQGGTSTQTLLTEIGKWGAPVFAVAVVGGLYYVFRHRPEVEGRLRLGKWGRAALVTLMLGTALLAPANQLRIHTDVALQKHIGFGLMFAAPLAGYGLVRLVGGHFGRLQLGIGAAVVAFSFGMSQSHIMFRGWPDATRLVATIKQYQKPGAHYLVEIDEVPIYYLRGDTNAEPSQFTSTFAFLYLSWQGKWLTGDIAYQTAVEQGYFQVVAIDGTTTPEVDQAILKGLHSPISPYRIVSEYNVQTAYGPTTYQVWVKK